MWFEKENNPCKLWKKARCESWLRNGNLIWGKHADLSFPLNALYFGNLELCCDDEWPEMN